MKKIFVPSKYANGFPHHVNLRNNPRIRVLRFKHGSIGYGVYLMILEYLYDSLNNRIGNTELDLKLLAESICIEVEELKKIIDTCIGIGLLSKSGDYMYSDLFQNTLYNIAKKQKSSIDVPLYVNVYLLRVGKTSTYKIGQTSRSVRIRLGQIAYETPFSDIHIVDYAVCEIECEKYLHDKFKTKRLDNGYVEFFDLSQECVDFIISFLSEKKKMSYTLSSEKEYLHD